MPITGIRSGRSLLIEDGALPWIVHNANDESAPIRRHIELALCHLAQHGKSKISNLFQQWMGKEKNVTLTFVKNLPSVFFSFSLFKM